MRFIISQCPEELPMLGGIQSPCTIRSRWCRGVWVGPADVGATLKIHVEISSEFAKKTEINPSCQLGSEQLMQLLRLGVPLCSASTTASSTPLRRTLPPWILRLERSCNVVAFDMNSQIVISTDRRR